METVATKRNTWVACPECGHKVGKARTCDMEFKCKNCGHEFEAVIGTPWCSAGRAEFCMIRLPEKENAETEARDGRKPTAAALGVLLSKRAVRRLREKGTRQHLGSLLGKPKRDDSQAPVSDVPAKLLRT